MARLMIIIALLACSSSAFAGFSSPSYTERVVSYEAQIRSVVSAYALDPETAHSAKKLAAAWIYLGPCAGIVGNIGVGVADATLRAVPAMTPDNRYNQAVLIMIAMLTRENLGRKALDGLCQYALDIGKSE